MKIYKIYACAFGTYLEADVDCPLDWRGSGCYDVEHELYQEATFEVAALSLENALKMVCDKFNKYQGEWSYSVYSVFYNPNAVEENDGPDGETEEIVDWYYETPVVDTDFPEEYSKEILL